MPRPPGAGVLLGLAPAAGVAVWTWFAQQSPAFRAGIELVAIDPSAPYAAEIRAALPHAWIAVDHWHLVRLANEMVTEVRQRVARQRHGRRGIKADPVWAHRRMLLTADDRLSAHQLTRLRWILAQDDSTDEIGAAWGCTQLLRQLLAETDPNRIRHRLWRFYDACARADIDETTRLARTIETWWPAIAVALAEQVTNARTEGFNRIIKQVKRVGCGFATWTTINAASWPTSQSPDRDDKRHDQATPRGARVHSFYLPCRRVARSDPSCGMANW